MLTTISSIFAHTSGPKGAAFTHQIVIHGNLLFCAIVGSLFTSDQAADRRDRSRRAGAFILCGRLRRVRLFVLDLCQQVLEQGIVIDLVIPDGLHELLELGIL